MKLLFMPLASGFSLKSEIQAIDYKVSIPTRKKGDHYYVQLKKKNLEWVKVITGFLTDPVFTAYLDLPV